MPLPSEETTPPGDEDEACLRRGAVCAASRVVGHQIDPRVVVTPSTRTAGADRSAVPDERRSRPCPGRPEQLPRVLAGGLVALAGAQHPHELVDHAVAVERGDGRPARAAPTSSLAIVKWRVGERGDLRQVGDAEDLAARRRGARRCSPTARAVWPPIPASISSNTSSGVAGAPSPARGPWAAVRDAQQRQHHPRELAARGDLAQRPRRHARVRRDQSSTVSAPRGPQPSGRGVSTTSNGASAIASSASRDATAAASSGAAWRRRARELAGELVELLPAGRAPPRASSSATSASLELLAARRGSARRARGPRRSSRRACARAARTAPADPRPPRAGRARPRLPAT